jgi:hypothetical protein
MRPRVRFLRLPINRRLSVQDASGKAAKPKLPHEHDEAAEAGSVPNDPHVQQAFQDVQRGQMDTDNYGAALRHAAKR